MIGEDFASASRSPHLDSFRQRGIEVLYFTDPVDPIMLMGLNEFDGHKLRSADEADIDLSEVGEVKEEDRRSRQKRCPRAISARCASASPTCWAIASSKCARARIWSDSPARLVSKDSDPQRNMFRINRLMDRDYELPVKILELNPRHPLLRNLSGMIARTPENPLIDSVVEQVFETALLQDGIHPDPAAMAARLYELMQAATGGSGNVPSSEE